MNASWSDIENGADHGENDLMTREKFPVSTPSEVESTPHVTHSEDTRLTEPPRKNLTEYIPHPTVGRIVHYYGVDASPVPRAAVITEVIGDGRVSLAVFQPTGGLMFPTGVAWRHADNPSDGSECWVWPPKV